MAQLNMKPLFIALFLICVRFSTVSCSVGDRSQIYMNCLNICVSSNCTYDGEEFQSAAAGQQDIWCKLLQWSCRDECRYQCMWFTVSVFNNAGVETPKFHGRWPFTRFLGMQEPASAFASMLNFATNAYMYRKIHKLTPSKGDNNSIITFWHVFAMVCMHAWAWSTFFHMRDTPFTEFMDYACALSMVMSLFVAAIVSRLCYKQTKLALAILLVPLFYFVTHVRYLYDGVINYDYNMMLNVFFGVLGSLLWLTVSWRQWRARRHYAWRMLAFTLLSGVSLSLELFDFPPKLGWDAHALWHLSTAPLPLLFYRYVIDDLQYLQSNQLEKIPLKLT